MEGESKLEKGEKTSGAKRPLISIVDDDGALRSSLEDLIRSVGFRVQVFSSAEAFLRSNQVQTTDCLILDVRMPGMTGPGLQRDLRSKRAGRSADYFYLGVREPRGTSSSFGSRCCGISVQALLRRGPAWCDQCSIAGWIRTRWLRYKINRRGCNELSVCEFE
jgi:Response regulator receiver domain